MGVDRAFRFSALKRPGPTAVGPWSASASIRRMAGKVRQGVPGEKAARRLGLKG